MKEFDKLKEIFRDESCIVDFITKKRTKEIDFFLEWLKLKDNSILLHSNIIQSTNFYQDSILQITLLHNRSYSYLTSNFYLIFTYKNQISIMSINFIEKKSFEIMEKILIRLHIFLSKNQQFINRFDAMMLYFPFKFGNIFSKERYLYEINSKYMESLRSIKSIDGGRKTVLDQYQIKKNHALLNEYYVDNASCYNKNYVYIDLIKFLLKRDDLLTYYIDLNNKDKACKILDTIDAVFFYSVINQQNAVYNVVKNHLKIAEYPSGRYSIDEVYEKAIRKINKAMKSKDFLKYSKSIKGTTTYLKVLQESYKADNLTEYEHIIFNEFAINYPLYHHLDYSEHLKNILFDYQIEADNIEYIADNIFGEHSIYYNEDGNEKKFFFEEIKSLFDIYESSTFNTKNLKDLFDYNWRRKILRLKKHLY